jgi:quercetin dioxygenase-like cupin family protein
MKMADTITIGKLVVNYLRDGAKDGQMGAFELLVPPGSNVPPPHSHTLNEEYVYVLEGKLRYSVNQETRDLNPGDSMSTPKGSMHGFSNPFDKDARALIVMSPDIGAQYFHDVAAVINSGGPPDKAKLLAVMDRYGLKIPQPK